jgi:hypothetical protein
MEMFSHRGAEIIEKGMHFRFYIIELRFMDIYYPKVQNLNCINGASAEGN